MEIFKQLSIGGVDKRTLILRLTEAGVQFNKYTPILFEDPLFSPDAPIQKVELVKPRFTDLGLNHRCSYRNIVDHALKRELKLCPMHSSAFLRLEYMDQPEGPYLTIVSDELEGDENYPTGFYLRNTDNKLWLRGYRAKGETEWPPNHQFVFMK